MSISQKIKENLIKRLEEIDKESQVVDLSSELGSL